MEIKFNNEKGEGEFVFSWKEIWILIKKRKLTFNEYFLDKVVTTLMLIKHNLVTKRKEKNVEKTNTKTN
jgi:hypothetical protein